jgi:hypothetical protein
MASACTAQDSEKCPVPAISTCCPGASRLAITASQAPWPLQAYMKTSAVAVCSSALSPVSQAWITPSSRGSARSMGWRRIASMTSSGTRVGPGEWRNRWPGMRLWGVMPENYAPAGLRLTSTMPAATVASATSRPVVTLSFSHSAPNSSANSGVKNTNTEILVAG